MPRRIDTDWLLRNYHTLSPSERSAVVRQVMREAKQARAEEIARVFRALGDLIGSAFGFLWRRVVAAWRRYRAHRQVRLAAARLHTMDDRMLKDIGVYRSEIDVVVRGVNDSTRLPRPLQRARNVLAVRWPRPAIESRSAAPDRRAA